jgi:hypothetical protein
LHDLPSPIGQTPSSGKCSGHVPFALKAFSAILLLEPAAGVPWGVPVAQAT